MVDENFFSQRKGLEEFVEGESDLKHPVVRSLRSSILERNACKQDSDLYCPYCKINLPYNELTVLPAISNEIMDKEWKQKYFCTLCDEDFYKD